MNNEENFISRNVSNEKIALFDANKNAITYGQLLDLTILLKNHYFGGIAMLKIANEVHLLALYVAFIEAKIPVMLIDSKVEDSFFDLLIKEYQPSIVVAESFEDSNYQISTFSEFIFTSGSKQTQVNQILGLMLTTSGSTGNPKFVRISHDALRSNSRDIAQGLDIDSSHVAITCLPTSYTYGLSIVNSHIFAGASILVTEETIVTKEFWEMIDQFGVTSFAGVPTTYKLLRQMRWSPGKYKSLRYATQAGGRLQDDDRKYFLDLLEAEGIEFIIMYGQTEATARITICPSDFLKNNISTAGFPIPNGEIEIIEKDENGVGSVVYKGPNVMLGYAESAEDLMSGDNNKGVLETGDMGYLQDGALFLTGRIKRIVKIFGIRVSLDDVDAWISQFATGVAIQGNDTIEIFIEESSAKSTPTSMKSELAKKLKVHPSGLNIHEIDSLPLLISGKVDLRALERLLDE